MSVLKKIQELTKKIIDRLGEDELTPLERMARLRQFEEADRVTGSFAFWAPSTIGITDISTHEYYTNPEKMYYCQLFALDVFNHDYPALLADVYNAEPEALGAKIAFQNDNTPMIVKPAMSNKGDLERLHIPNPLKDARLPYRIEICKMHHDLLGKFFPTVTSINAPFSMAVGMRGYEALIIDMVEDPKFTHKLLEFCTEVIISFGIAIKTACGSYPSIVDAWSSIPNLSPELFYEFSLPYATNCFQAFDHSGWSFGGGHQLSGDWEESLIKILGSGTKTFSLFEENITGIRGERTFNLKEVKKICVENKVFLTTSIHPDTMLKGPPDKIRSLIERWSQEISTNGGHGFYTSVIPGTPLEHIKTYVQTIQKTTFPILSAH